MRFVSLFRSWFHRLVLADRLTQVYDRFKHELSLGNQGELIAERFLLKLGWYIVGRSYSTEFGELDLIAIDNRRTVVFVEVKTRSGLGKGSPEDAVDEEKQRRVAQMASSFIARHQLEKERIRFDVISILITGEKRPEIRHFRNAFDAPESVE